MATWRYHLREKLTGSIQRILHIFKFENRSRTTRFPIPQIIRFTRESRGKLRRRGDLHGDIATSLHESFSSLCPVAQHVVGTRGSRHTDENHAIQQKSEPKTAECSSISKPSMRWGVFCGVSVRVWCVVCVAGQGREERRGEEEKEQNTHWTVSSLPLGTRTVSTACACKLVACAWQLAALGLEAGRLRVARPRRDRNGLSCPSFSSLVFRTF